MLRVGLTGNIGSGKSVVSRIFSTLGIPVYHADEESKKFLGRPDVIREVAALFGPAILTESGAVKRKALASVVFGDPVALSRLNSILHPLVKDGAREWAALYAERPYVIHEAAIIFESGFRQEYDRIIYITCPKETAIARVMERDGVKREDVLGRLRFQWEDEVKMKESDFVIVNDGVAPLLPQVLEIHDILIRNSLSPKQ
jgi:dephospho-CoA kinase